MSLQDTKTVVQAFADAVIEAMDEKYELVWNDYRDGLGRDQIEAVVAGDRDEIDGGTSFDWISDVRYDGARRELDELANKVRDEWEREEQVEALVANGTITDWGEGDFDYGRLEEDFHDSTYWDEARFVMEERDTSDPVKDLAHHTGKVLMRHVLANEDAALYGNHGNREVLEWLAANAEEGSSIPVNTHNLDVVSAVTAESMHSLAYTMGMLVYAVDLGDIYDFPHDTEWVEVINPYLYLGNYYQGDGYCSEKPLEATIRIKRSDLRTDRGAPGYGWDEVAGVYVSAYEAKIRAVPTTTEESK